MSNKILITFISTHQALRFEKTLLQNGYSMQIIPVPRSIKASCGLAGLISENDFTLIKENKQWQELVWENIYRFFPDQSKEPQLIKINC